MEQIACINFVLNDARTSRELKPIMTDLDLFKSFNVRKFTQKNSYQARNCLNWAAASMHPEGKENLVALLLLVNPLLADLCLKITTIPRKNITKHYNDYVLYFVQEYICSEGYKYIPKSIIQNPNPIQNLNTINYKEMLDNFRMKNPLHKINSLDYNNLCELYGSRDVKVIEPPVIRGREDFGEWPNSMYEYTFKVNVHELYATFQNGRWLIEPDMSKRVTSFDLTRKSLEGPRIPLNHLVNMWWQTEVVGLRVDNRVPIDYTKVTEESLLWPSVEHNKRTTDSGFIGDNEIFRNRFYALEMNKLSLVRAVSIGEYFFTPSQVNYIENFLKSSLRKDNKPVLRTVYEPTPMGKFTKVGVYLKDLIRCSVMFRACKMTMLYSAQDRVTFYVFLIKVSNVKQLSHSGSVSVKILPTPQHTNLEFARKNIKWTTFECGDGDLSLQPVLSLDRATLIVHPVNTIEEVVVNISNNFVRFSS